MTRPHRPKNETARQAFRQFAWNLAGVLATNKPEPAHPNGQKDKP